jgi:hypothetical protein
MERWFASTQCGTVGVKSWLKGEYLAGKPSQYLFSPLAIKIQTKQALGQGQFDFFFKINACFSLLQIRNKWQCFLCRMTAETSKDMASDVYELMGYDCETKKVRNTFLWFSNFISL